MTAPRRRRLLRLALVAPVLAALGGCQTVPRVAGRAAPGGGGRVALLLPLSGRLGAVGQAMAAAARAQAERHPGLVIDLATTGGTPAGAGDAAAAALANGAQVILGPLTAPETDAVITAVAISAPRVPILSFSNDPALRGRGAILLGLGPGESVDAVLGYARNQGVRRVAVVAAPGPLADAAMAAASASAAARDVSLVATLLRDPAATDPTLVDDLRAVAGGQLPDAVLLPDGGGALTAFANALAGSGLQLLGSEQWASLDPSRAPALFGGWYPGLVPAGADLASAHAAPGVLALLAADGVALAAQLLAAGETGADGVATPSGRLRVLADGTVRRDLAVLVVDSVGVRRVATIAGA